MQQHSLESLATKATVAEVVSFDLFDTLFVRPLCDPEDLFDMIGARFEIPDFRRLRRSAQTKAFQTMHARGLKEITLDGIYESFGKLPVDAELLKQAEHELELMLTLPNPELIGWFVELARTKRVVITSDMYLPQEFFETLFAKHGLPALPLFISSARNATKRDAGELFQLVSAEMGVAPERILHVGDNELSDIRRAAEQRLSTFHYVDLRRNRLPARALTPAASIAFGLPRTFLETIEPGSFEALGFEVGGPAALSFLHWIKTMARRDSIDLVLFTARDGYVLERMEKRGNAGEFPRAVYFKSSRTALTLAATNETNFEARLPFLLSGAQELSPFELLERIGVTPPADHVMRDLDLGPEVRLNDRNVDRFRSFLWACRWDILKTCRIVRAGLFTYLAELGVKDGMRVAMVDVGWNGTTQEAFNEALNGLYDIELFGYYLCLTERPECNRRKKMLRMESLLSASSVGTAAVERLYANRVAVELFFSAPHAAIIGYEFGAGRRVHAVEDPGRGSTAGLSSTADAISSGIERYGAYASALYQRVGVTPEPLEVVKPLLDFVQAPSAETRKLLSSVTNFDAWASSRNRAMRLDEYLA
ncbi:hydrolase [Caballeronia sp. GAFFF2]|uniref:HAD family hydrolase n=1 Tax=Caballeronia sp. GAFFF2 TaxID=2921741 RepID=UPI0020280EC8|nr:hydrolase [Caballeronia sp. GAFFF2]